jgi:uracil-DNA glycosylase
MLNEPHVAPLTAFVKRVRQDTGRGDDIPFFDPLDGGINARALFVFEAPGPKAVESGFVSRNNPDESAKNFFLACENAQLRREDTVAWNVVPWYIGDGTKVRPAAKTDIVAGIPYLLDLLGMLPRLGAVVLAGGKAQSVRKVIEPQLLAGVTVFKMPHPSAVFVNRAPANRARLVPTIQEVRDYLSRRGVPVEVAEP